jgi:transcriptional regulator GlxA family with amidase domain
LTCSGGASTAHLAAYLVDRHIGRAAAQKSLHILIIDDQMAGEMPQPGTPLELSTRDPLVRKALHLFQQNMDAPPSVDAIAGQLGVSRRKLERHFRGALDISPAEASLAIRLSHARNMLARSAASIASIAAHTGFCDASHFIRVFRERVGRTPQSYRREAA